MSQRRIFSRRSSSRGGRFPFGLVIILVAIGICLFIPATRLDLKDITASNSDLPTALPTFTPPPIPTKPNIGRIIFTCTRGDFNQLCLVNADGTGYQQITNVQSHNYYPVYSPDGSSIVYASNQNGGYFDLFLFIFEGSRLLRLTENIGNTLSPSFSPDGSRIVFVNRAAEGPASLWTVEVTGKNPKLLYAGPNTIVSADWSPDGKTIAFAMAVGSPNAYEVFLMDSDGTNVRQLTNGLPGIGGSLDWSPDGKYLLIYAGSEGDKNIFQIDVEAQTAAQLTDGGNNAASSYSPDGFWIAFNSLRNDDQADLFIMRADGSSMRQITDNPEPDWQPQWEP